MPTATLKLKYKRTIYEVAHIIDGIVGMERPRYKPFFSSSLFGGDYGLEVGANVLNIFLCSPKRIILD